MDNKGDTRRNTVAALLNKGLYGLFTSLLKIMKIKNFNRKKNLKSFSHHNISILAWITQLRPGFLK